jgi:RNA polymerase sigma-70 factor (ECF subfamily)
VEESRLVKQAARGDVDAFGDLFNRYAKDVYHLALSMGHRGGEAEDLMQDTFLAAFEGIGRFERRSSFKTWLFSILFRQSSRQRRYLGLRKTEVLDEEQMHQGNNGASRPDGNWGHESRLDAHTMLATLSPEHRAVLVLRELQGLSYVEIAESLNIPRGTVESRLFRARTILRERFQEYRAHPPSIAAGPASKPVESRHE